MRTLFLLFVSMLCTVIFAQEKTKFKFEFGLNYALNFTEEGNNESHPGFYLNGHLWLKETPLNINIKLAYESYATQYKINYDGKHFKGYDNGRSLTLLPYINYSFSKIKKVNYYVGAGAGLSFDNINTGVFNPGYSSRLILSGQVGAIFWHHLHLSAQFNLAPKHLSRGLFNIGYIF